MSQDIFWMIIDILEENNIVEATDQEYLNILNNQDFINDFWHYGYSIYKDDPSGVKDRINIYTNSVNRYKNILSLLKQEENRIEGYTGVNIDIVGHEPSFQESRKYAYISIVVDWKKINDRFNDFKSFSKFLYNHLTK
jgi:hypothetical protein